MSLLIELPLIVSAQRYHNLFKSGNRDTIKAATEAKPYDRNSFFSAISTFQSNMLTARAMSLAEQTVEHFPNTHIAWKLPLDSTLKGCASRGEAFLKLHELDSNSPYFSTG